jgi:hypothetical protein
MMCRYLRSNFIEQKLKSMGYFSKNKRSNMPEMKYGRLGETKKE